VREGEGKATDAREGGGVVGGRCVWGGVRRRGGGEGYRGRPLNRHITTTWPRSLEGFKSGEHHGPSWLLSVPYGCP
jgi:hypothetical protein